VNEPPIAIYSISAFGNSLKDISFGTRNSPKIPVPHTYNSLLKVIAAL